MREPLASTGPFKIHDMRAVNRRPWWLASIREMAPSKRGLGLVGAALAMDDAWTEHRAEAPNTVLNTGWPVGAAPETDDACMALMDAPWMRALRKPWPKLMTPNK